MANLQQYQAKICLTTAACLVRDGRVLLVKHKKLGIWLNPGGHIEENEMPHLAAEREFWEETGIKVRAVALTTDAKFSGDADEFVPSPILTNLHWVSRPNYDKRQVEGEAYKPLPQWKRGCEQHYNFLYVVEPVDEQSIAFTKNVEETDGIAWFTPAELGDLNLHSSILHEIDAVFHFWKKHDTKRK